MNGSAIGAIADDTSAAGQLAERLPSGQSSFPTASGEIDNGTGAFGESHHIPELCYFYGIHIWMNFSDQPPSHFHAVYGEHQAQIQVARTSVELDRVSGVDP